MWGCGPAVSYRSVGSLGDRNRSASALLECARDISAICARCSMGSPVSSCLEGGFGPTAGRTKSAAGSVAAAQTGMVTGAGGAVVKLTDVDGSGWSPCSEIIRRCGIEAGGPRARGGGGGGVAREMAALRAWSRSDR